MAVSLENQNRNGRNGLVGSCFWNSAQECDGGKGERLGCALWPVLKPRARAASWTVVKLYGGGVLARPDWGGEAA